MVIILLFNTMYNKIVLNEKGLIQNSERFPKHKHLELVKINIKKILTTLKVLSDESFVCGFFF